MYGERRQTEACVCGDFMVHPTMSSGVKVEMALVFLRETSRKDFDIDRRAGVLDGNINER